jgi:hypothetical protein
MFYWSSYILTHSYTFLVADPFELHVHSPAFDKECALYSRGIGKSLPPGDSDSDYSDDDSSLWEKDSFSNVSSLESSSRYGVSKLEARLY